MSEIAQQQPKPRVSREARLVLIGLAVVVLAAVGYYGIYVAAYQGPARGACHDAVKDQLKAPSTASFDGDLVSNGDDGVKITGYVASENSFGAKVRTAYACTYDNGFASVDVDG